MEVTNDRYSQIYSELQFFFPILEKASESVRNEGISKYPIFVASKLPMEVGILLVSNKNSATEWDIHVSTLEEFSAKQIIQSNRIDEFRKIYKDPETHYCVFILGEPGAQFLFIPS